MSFQVYHHSKELPDSWDIITQGHFFMQRGFLSLMEQVNPCDQSYHIEEALGIAMVRYRLPLNIFSFWKRWQWKLPVYIVGLPLSVSQPGFVFLKSKQPAVQKKALSAYIQSLPGNHLVLNCIQELELTEGHTLPDYTLTVNWTSLEEYFANLRSHYRHRLKKSHKFLKTLEVKEIKAPHEFTTELYSLYLAVYEPSRDKLEQLAIDYFRECIQSEVGRLVVFYKSQLKPQSLDTPLAFVQILGDQDTLRFLFCGIHPEFDARSELYNGMMLYMIEEAILGGYRFLSLGQTTGHTKTLVGGAEEQRKMYISAGGPLLKMTEPLLMRILSYRKQSIIRHVFNNKKDV